ncbi:MAG: nicotinate (nicotinamide) nucleotide adenylyltransferase [Acidobacteria bacterium]|nr:nicotinate (nicotinamide) nucleotide adenylyltransferase [Acidobacteriota bacterium]
MKRIAFYGGSFDPPHNGHLAIAEALKGQFALDEFVFIPAYHAPHKKEKKPTSPFHRFAMLALATSDAPAVKVSKIELDAPERPYSVETLTRLKNELTGTEIFFVIGADSWRDITTWREWETVLTIVNIIVVTRPGYEIGFDHVTDRVRARIVDRRGEEEKGRGGEGEKRRRGERETDNSDIEQSEIRNPKSEIEMSEIEMSEIRNPKSEIAITDAVMVDVSATEIRGKIRENRADWRDDVPQAVAKYIEKYELYK